MLGGLALQHCITQHILHIIVVFIELQRCAVPSKIIHVRIPERTKSVLVYDKDINMYVKSQSPLYAIEAIDTTQLHLFVTTEKSSFLTS